MKCDSCGAPVENGKCAYCGKVFFDELKAENVVHTEPAAEAAVDKSSKKNKRLTTCKACKKEIAKSAKVCPYCGAKNKKPIYKKWWFWLIIICLIGGIGSGGSDENKNDDTNRTVIEQPSESTQPTENTQPAENVQSTENTQPTEKTQPTESTQPTDSTQSAESTQPAETKKNSYESVLAEYTAKLQAATPGLIEEYKAEAANNTAGLEGLAEIANNKVSELAEIANDGVSEMAKLMYTVGSGKYEEYEKWATKLYDVYEVEAAKIYDVYTNSAM